MKIKLPNLFKLYRKVYEDAVMAAGPVGAGEVIDGGSEPNDVISNPKAPNSGICQQDVLGKYDPSKGVFGPGDFNIPKPVLKKPLRRFPFDGASVPAKKKRKH